MSDRPEQACVNCHFFSLERHERGMKMETTPTTIDQRSKTRDREFDWVGSSALKCYLGVWDEKKGFLSGYEDPDQRRHQEYVKRDRSGECFFFEHRSGMSLETAEELHDRKQERKRFERRNNVLWWSVLVALAGVLINAVIQLITLFYTAPK